MFPSPNSSCARWRSETSASRATILRVMPRRLRSSRTRAPRIARNSGSLVSCAGSAGGTSTVDGGSAAKLCVLFTMQYNTTRRKLVQAARLMGWHIRFLRVFY